MEPARLLCPWCFPGKSTGAGCHFLLQGIILTQGSSLHLLHWQADSLPLSHPGSPYTHKISSFWISFPFKSPRSRVPCAIQEVLVSYLCLTQWRIYINLNVTIHLSAFFSLGVHTFVLYIPVSISALQIRSPAPFFLDYTYKWHHIYVLSNHVKTDGKNHLQAKEKALRMKPTLPIPWPWTSKRQDCEKMHFLKLFKTPSLWYFVMAQPAN